MIVRIVEAGSGASPWRESNSLQRRPQHIVALRRYNRNIGGHSRFQQQFRICDGNDDVIRDDVLDADWRLTHLRYTALEGTIRESVHRELGRRPVMDVANVRFAD